MFLSNQKDIKNLINEKIREGFKRFIISGDSGTGKTFLINNIKGDLDSGKIANAIILSGDDYSEDRDYYPFNKYFTTCNISNHNHKLIAKNVTAKLVKGIPYVGNMTEYAVEQLFSIKESKFEENNKIFSKEEIDILFKLKYILSINCKYIFIDNLQWWDKKSLEFLHIILESCDKNESLSFFRDTIFIINVTTNQNSSNYNSLNRLIKSSYFQQFNLNSIKKEDYSHVLHYFGLTEDVIDKLINVLYSISGGHLQITQNIVSYLNSTDINELLENPAILQNSFLDILIEKKLSTCGAKGDLIKEVLKYASIIGKSFSLRELEYMTQNNQATLLDLIDNANKLYLLEKDEKSEKFVHEIVREIFHGKTEDDKYRYYGAFAESLKFIKPGDYKARMSCYLKMGLMDNAEVMYVLEYIKRVRCKNIIDIDFKKYKDILVVDSETNEFLNTMIKAYDEYFQKNYDEAIHILNNIDYTYKKLYTAEKDYLLSICLSKKLDDNSRNLAVERLKNYINIDDTDNEGEIWTRILLGLMIAHVHINQTEKALGIEKKVTTYLIERAEYDIEAKDKLNILRRKASSLYDSDKAAIFTKKSVEYFGPNNNGEPWNPIEYFMSLTNHVGNLIVCGEFEESYSYACNIVKQLKGPNKEMLTRIEIALNNYVLSSILAEKISISEAIGIMKVLVKHSTVYADSILLQINLANLLAMNNNIIESNNLLEDTYNQLKNKDSIEAYYELCIHSNRMVIAYLLGNQEKALNLLKLCNDIIPNIGDQYYYKKRNNYIEKLFKDNIVTDGASWLNVISQKFDLSQKNSMWKFYGLGYLFTDMAYWSES